MPLLPPLLADRAARRAGSGEDRRPWPPDLRLARASLLAAALLSSAAPPPLPAAAAAPPALEAIALRDDPRFPEPLCRQLVELGQITGRADDAEGVWLLGGDTRRLARLAWTDGAPPLEVTTIRGIAPEATLWGLAPIGRGGRRGHRGAGAAAEFWTVRDHASLVRFSAGGEVRASEPLPFRALSAGSWDGVVTARVLPRTAEEPLLWRRTGPRRWEPFGPFRAPSAASRLERVLGSMVACGHASGGRRPCWLAFGEPALSLVEPGGAWRTILLERPRGAVPRADLELAGAVPLTFQDVAVTGRGGFVVLAYEPVSPPPLPEEIAATATILARYTAAGKLLGAARLPEAVEMILGADHGPGEGDSRLLTANRRIVLARGLGER